MPEPAINAVRIAVASNGDPWVIDNARQIFELIGGTWQVHPGAALDIGAGGGAVWVIGSSATGIYQRI